MCIYLNNLKDPDVYGEKDDAKENTAGEKAGIHGREHWCIKDIGNELMHGGMALAAPQFR